MDTQVKARWQLLEKLEVRYVREWLKHKVWHAITVIASCREAQARRRIQLYLDDRLIDELTAAGTRIAKKDAKD